MKQNKNSSCQEFFPSVFAFLRSSSHPVLMISLISRQTHGGEETDFPAAWLDRGSKKSGKASRAGRAGPLQYFVFVFVFLFVFLKALTCCTLIVVLNKVLHVVCRTIIVIIFFSSLFSLLSLSLSLSHFSLSLSLSLLHTHTLSTLYPRGSDTDVILGQISINRLMVSWLTMDIFSGLSSYNIRC